jgi:hypothetical protein
MGRPSAIEIVTLLSFLPEREEVPSSSNAKRLLWAWKLGWVICCNVTKFGAIRDSRVKIELKMPQVIVKMKQCATKEIGDDNKGQ